jgi:hypothetical protein
VTVCLAALAEKSILIGVSDRMLTAGSGDVEFEPEQGKFWIFSPSIVALISGDATIQSEVLRQINVEVKNWILAAPESWVSVRAVAALYCQKLRELRRARAEEAILHPLGLDLHTFLNTQSSLQSELVHRVSERLIEYEFPTVLETIFMGIDNEGPLGQHGEKLNYAQLYVTYFDKLSWLTTVGFAAIGIGKAHAESQFTFSGHWPSKSFDETLLLAYAAKKRAEVAPGVGKNTDILVIGPRIGQTLKVEEKHLAELDRLSKESDRFEKSRCSCTEGDKEVCSARQKRVRAEK